MTSNPKHKADRKHRKHIEDGTLVSQKNRQYTLQTFINLFQQNNDYKRMIMHKIIRSSLKSIF